MKSRPGNIYRNTNRNIGVGKFTMDTVVVHHVSPNSPADLVGLEEGDIITHIDGKQV